jgi:ADP-ribose pyrophosphatase
MRPWKILERTPLYQAEPWLALERQKIQLPDGRIVPDYHRITLPDCAGVVAQVEDGRYLVQRQYRHGPQRVTLVLPGGTLDPGESPLHGVQRELREETGYVARDWKLLASVAMNANYGCGTLHIFSAAGARRALAPDNDDLEESEILFLTRDELRTAVANGEVAVLAAVAAIMLATSCP